METLLITQIKEQQPEWYETYTDKSIIGCWAQPHEVVGAVIFLDSGARSYVTGSFMLLDGGRRTIRPISVFV